LLPRLGKVRRQLKQLAMNGEIRRMRLLASALIVLASLTWSAAPTEALTRDQAQARQGAPQANRAATTRASAARQRPATTRQAATRPAATRQATTRQAAARPANTRQAATRPASSRRAATRPATTRQATTRQANIRQTQTARARNARGTRQASSRAAGRQQATATCRGRNCAPSRRSVSWQGGLEPATNEQARGCPTGTLATLAHGHRDIVRCMPL
jgi:hypothetical protein